ncbi:MAG: ACS family MFS transporter [Pseudomonadales bacterium]|nr:ACS family MFS transporter [Pseudomonadales bacterium]MCP5185499.1 ACS family MFS transporter [Pseudomonadales bacterium]
MNIAYRQRVVLLSFLAVFICYIDRVNISVAIIKMADTLQWDRTTQGFVMSSFFVGYLLLQIVGGSLADRFGGKVVLGVGVLAWSLFTVLTPFAAFAGLSVLILTRILMGMGEAVTFPSIYTMYSTWVPASERSRAVGRANSGIPTGTVFALITTPYIAEAWGWEWAFYLFGAVGLVWYVAWHRLVSAYPRQQQGISEAELRLIESGTTPDEARGPTPWAKLLRCKAVWAIIIAHFCNNWSLYVLLSWLPTFINQGLGVDYHAVGWVTMIPHVASFIFLNVAGALADRMIRAGRDVTFVRKLFQTIGFGSIATALMVVGYVESVWAAITIMTIGNALGAFVTGGFSVNHMDVAPKYAGTLMGITNTAGTIPGIIGVSVSGMILSATGSWTLVFQVAAGVTLFGLVSYLLLASGERQIE